MVARNIDTRSVAAKHVQRCEKILRIEERYVHAEMSKPVKGPAAFFLELQCTPALLTTKADVEAVMDTGGLILRGRSCHNELFGPQLSGFAQSSNSSFQLSKRGRFYRLKPIRSYR
uniref:Uncharacterized protein n=1 Tax=Haptolina ericina TaxID=156174 RepID=A0A7S3EYD6_9EUKA|mmetsp:Transcript_36354/g.82409  ORF Transcript_36354/g.82409 Transcript_36354/m.82409 type:complete len:116 (+) Transcript_36354:724-1071(+)